MKKIYELTVILSNETSEKEAAALVDGYLTKSGGKVVKTDAWGKKDLAYPIRKQTKGFYIYFEIEMESKEAVELDKRLRLEEKIMRYLLVSRQGKLTSKPSAQKEKNGSKKSE